MINALSPLWIPQTSFNEALYLQRFPDIGVLVKMTLVPSGWVHYTANVEAEPWRNIPGLNTAATSVSGLAVPSPTPVVPADIGIPTPPQLPLPVDTIKPCCGSCAQGLGCEGKKHPLEQFEWVLWVAVGVLLVIAFTPRRPA